VNARARPKRTDSRKVSQVSLRAVRDNTSASSRTIGSANGASSHHSDRVLPRGVALMTADRRGQEPDTATSRGRLAGSRRGGGPLHRRPSPPVEMTVGARILKRSSEIHGIGKDSPQSKHRLTPSPSRFIWVAPDVQPSEPARSGMTASPPENFSAQPRRTLRKANGRAIESAPAGR
jgi:hypothetical protein